MKRPVPFLRGLAVAAAAVFLPCLSGAAPFRELAVPTGKTENKAPAWAQGTFVYRVSTPDSPDVLPSVEQGLSIVHHLLDDSVRQIPIVNGLIGHDHPGKCNWDGLWPYWGRVTFRAGDWNALGDFMRRAKEQDGAAVSFHVNLTDVNAGLRDYPETREFFKKLVETKSIYRRDRNPATGKRDVEPPYVMQEIPKEAADPIEIVSLVNYKNFWDSGLAKEMIDAFYAHLPYAPPLLYLDVLTTTGGNFATGLPDGPLGGGEKSQEEGVFAIADYLASKGTALATEGDRRYLAGRATYGWLHCIPGISSDDYAYIAGTARKPAWQQVAGNTGCFNVSPIASTPEMLARVREHYANLLAGKPDAKKMPGPETWHLADRIGTRDEFDMCPGIPGDRYRGDWADLVNDFYLTGIQELYHIGRKDVRTALFFKEGIIHVFRFVLTDSAGKEIAIPVADCVRADDGMSVSKIDSVKKSGRLMFESPLHASCVAPEAGTYRLTVYGCNPGSGHGAMNVYANGRLQFTADDIAFTSRDAEQPVELGAVELRAGENALSFDTGPMCAKWSDGTEASWPEPWTGKGFKVTNGDVTFADDYDRMWPDTWSGRKKIYFFSWDGTGRSWRLPAEWASVKKATLYPLTPDGRGKGTSVDIADRNAALKLPPQIPCVLVPAGD